MDNHLGLRVHHVINTDVHSSLPPSHRLNQLLDDLLALPDPLPLSQGRNKPHNPLLPSVLPLLVVKHLDPRLDSELLLGKLLDHSLTHQNLQSRMDLGLDP